MFGWPIVMMKFRTLIHQAMLNIQSTKLRAALAVLGVTIGTASVVILVSSGNMAMQAAMSGFESMNTHTMTLNIWHDDSAKNAVSSFMDKVSLRDIELMQMRFIAKQAWVPFQIEFPPIRYEGAEFKSPSLATTSDVNTLFGLSIVDGRGLSILDDQEYDCVVGFDLAKKLQSIHKEEIIGTQIKIYDRYFTIIGIYQKKHYPLSIGMNINDGIVFPIYLLHQLTSHDEINNILINIDGTQNVDKVQEDISDYLSSNFSNLSVQFHDPRELLHNIDQQQNTLLKFLGLIGSVSLFVGGIGIMNVMLVSIIQRQREIGVRKALGARMKDIRRLFLVEALLIAMAGGLLGIVFGLLMTKLISLSMGWVYQIYYVPITYGFLVSVITGLFFGIYPAQQAARSKTVKCLNTLM